MEMIMGRSNMETNTYIAMRVERKGREKIHFKGRGRESGNQKSQKAGEILLKKLGTKWWFS